MIARSKRARSGPTIFYATTTTTTTITTYALLLLSIFKVFSHAIEADNSHVSLRYSRHVDPRELMKTENDKHNHKPVFSNCPNYAPIVKENEAIGTFVIQLHAEDRDPADEGGTITYTLVTGAGENLKFEINSISGVVTTTTILDRDEPNREKELYLTVLASDNGRPQLDDVCTFKVTVEDINDNAPIFDKYEYKESVRQDMPVAREVMRISATDIDDGKNSVVRYSLRPIKADDGAYFRIDANTGVIYLNQTILDKPPGYNFAMNAIAKDLGDVPQSSIIKVEIKVVESHKKNPTFTVLPTEPIKLPENFSDYDVPIARVEALSNIKENPDFYIYELLSGKTEQTNKYNTFRMVSQKNVAEIKLAKALDYETNTEYTLRLRVRNQYQLGAETNIHIHVLDVNDNIPVFREMTKGSVLENEPPGSPVMQVKAIDFDGTSEHNQVSYELGNHNDYFTIDRYTGNVTTLRIFDREVEESYTVKVIAIDNSPSALFKTGEHNKGEQNFRIEIADKNDNPPGFTQKEYIAKAIPEDTNINALVVEVRAIDADTAAAVVYSIIDGNVDASFYIENTTGKIRVNKPLDYEKITQYNLTVRAFDGVFDDTAIVRIYIDNVNDNKPVFLNFNKNLTILEETLVEGCLTRVLAYDPDIKNRNADQHIVYSILKPEHQPLISIDKDGCMRLKKPLNRDKPPGYPTWTINVVAQDEDGSPNSLKSVETIDINLIDINDNAPFLDIPHPVIWYENQPPGHIIKLKAKDYDSEENGPPYSFRIDVKAESTVLKSFEIRNEELFATVVFDREERKSYDIPIAIRDSGEPPLTGVSILTVIIGDRNDNQMEDGHSSIFVYKYAGMNRNVEIGRVYVEDLDDWDLDDKTFDWHNQDVDGFELDRRNGMITLDPIGVNGKSFLLKFRVTEQGLNIPLHYAFAAVNVTIKDIPQEAVTKSGSIRFLGITAEEFVAPDTYGISKKDTLHEQLSSIFNVPVDNVDVFTVLHSPHQNKSLMDVRFSVHGSPYYEPEKLNTIVNQEAERIESEMGASVLMTSIDECIFEKVHCNGSCRSVLNTYPEPYVVYTNVTSFVGVNAVVDPQCNCHPHDSIATCLNGGILSGGRCRCSPEYEGPRCECLSISLNGHGYTIMPPSAEVCEDSRLSLDITPRDKNGLIFYLGPMRYSPKLGVQDFMSLELRNGNPVLYVDYGEGTLVLDKSNGHNDVEDSKINLYDGKSHRIYIAWTKTAIEMEIDNCGSRCIRVGAPLGSSEFLNVFGPLQIGGLATNLQSLQEGFKWHYTPTEKGFNGRISNLTINGLTYNLGQPAMWQDADSSCGVGITAGFTFGIDTNFLVAIAICIIILLILLLAVVVHRRKTDDLCTDTDDVRQNIINYEDEGGGEVDANYDLNVLRAMCHPMNDLKITSSSLDKESDGVPDIFDFLDDKKDYWDNEPENNPFDDVRHYAYEGEGNSDGSLSSLASCTDDGDLKFNYLSDFGSRFCKLADMYGEEPSDLAESSEASAASDSGDRGSESWC